MAQFERLLSSDPASANSTGADIFFRANGTSSSLPDNATLSFGEATLGDDAYYQGFTNKFYLVCPRITATISLFAIVCVAIEAWKDLRADGKRAGVVRGNRIRSSTTTASNVCIITRIQLFYQIPLFCFALAFALGTTTAPKDALWGPDEIWGATGNTSTCSFQGFLTQFGIHGTIGWDAVLSTTYLMMVRFKVTKLRLHSWEKYYHIVIWPIALAVSFYPLAQGMYNFNNTACWLESYPNNCVGDECQRGEGAPLWQNMASLLTMLHIMYSIAMVIFLYSSIRRLESQHHRYLSSVAETNPSDGNMMNDNSSTAISVSTTSRRKNSRAVGIQGMLYASGMVLTGLPSPIAIVLWNAFGLWSDGFGTFAASSLPLVGYVNFVIFMRGRSTENCHTQYAKFLRRAHSWIFDYRLTFSWCFPGRWCNCMAAFRQEEGDVTRSIGRAKREGSVAASANGDFRRRERRLTTLHPIEENGEDDCTSNAEVGTGAWAGFLISWKQTGQRVSQWVSELGASLASEASDSEWESESEYDGIDEPPLCPVRLRSERYAHWVVEDDDDSVDRNNSKGKRSDGAPSRPLRLQSEAERPPVRPVRLVSELPDLETSHDTLDLDRVDAEEDHPETPPVRPVRLVSEIPDLETSHDTLDLDHVDAEEDHPERPPVRPVRLVSEIPDLETSHDTLDLDHVDAEEDHPVEAAGCFVSTRRFQDDSNGLRGSSNSAPPAKPVRTISDAKALESALPCNRLRTPPLKPERYVSEVEASDLDDSLTTADIEAPLRKCSTWTGKFHHRSSWHAPVKPERCVSEIEAPGLMECSSTKQGSDSSIMWPCRLKPDNTDEVRVLKVVEGDTVEQPPVLCEPMASTSPPMLPVRHQSGTSLFGIEVNEKSNSSLSTSESQLLSRGSRHTLSSLGTVKEHSSMGPPSRPTRS